MSKELTSVPLPSIRRMPMYLRVLEQMIKDGNSSVSSADIANVLNLKPIQVRKDLSITGITGRPKTGYDIQELQSSIRKFLGWDKVSDAFLVGAGALGSALLGFQGFQENGLDIVAAFDINEKLVGTKIHDKKVLELAKLPELVKRMGVCIAILTVPREAAQEITDILVEAGIKGIWNFASSHLNVPEDVVVQNENIASGLAVLSVKLEDQLM